MLNNGKSSKKILSITVAVLAVALVYSLAGTVFASGDDGPRPSIFHMDVPIRGSEDVPTISVGEFLVNTAETTGLNAIINGEEEVQDLVDPEKTTIVPGWARLVMILIGFLVIYLGAGKGFEPLLLIPIGFGTVLVNIPGGGMYGEHGMLKIIYDAGVGNEFFPMLIFMGIGAMTDFGPLIANPKTAILGGAAQLGVFVTLFGVALMNLLPGVEYNMFEACGIAIIGGADGPTSIYVASKLAKPMMAVIAVAAYSYMALVPNQNETAPPRFPRGEDSVPDFAFASGHPADSAGCTADRYACVR